MIIPFYLSGIGTAAFALAGVFFLKFWKVSKDNFFALMCLACWLLAFERVVGLITYFTFPTDVMTLDNVRGWTFLFRLLAFILIVTAVIDKNRSSKIS